MPIQPTASEGTKSTGPEKPRKLSWRRIVGICGVVIAVIAFLSDTFNVFEFMDDHLHFSKPTPTAQPTPVITPTILPPPQTLVIVLVPTPTGTLHSIRLVARSIPKDGSVHNLFVSIDDGPQQNLYSVSENVDKTFDMRFSKTIRVGIDVKPEIKLYEELYIDREMVASGWVDHSGFTYQKTK